MRKLNLTEWSSLAEVIASVAVVISLIFVGYSIQQNSHTLQATNDSLIFEIQDSVMSEVSGDPAMAAIRVRLLRDEGLTGIEAERWTWHLWRWLALWELAYNRHSDRLMDDGDWAGWDRAFKMVLLDPNTGLKEDLWKLDRDAYGAEFAAHVDAAYANGMSD